MNAPARASAAPSIFRVPVRSGRVVSIRYTPFARHKRLASHTLYGPPLDRAVAEIAFQLERHPGELTAREIELGAVAIAARMRPSAPPELLPGTDQILAIVTGITQSEFAVALREIQRPNWAMVTR